jgi:drug/metabolite transporter (DMT)-like permease
LSATSFGAMSFLVCVSSVAGFVAYAVVLRDWPAARAGSFGVVNPLVSVLLGVVVLHEALTPRMVGGMIVTLASVTWVQRQRARRVP